jgi:NAD(P)-dependent dehydrogenase (short-subunit alcohol dehydrogenase family)
MRLRGADGPRGRVLRDHGHPGRRWSTTTEEVTNGGGRARFWHLEVTDEPAVERVLCEVSDAFGKVDVLVNNAGIDKPTHEIALDEWDRVISAQGPEVFGRELDDRHPIGHVGEPDNIDMASCTWHRTRPNS